MTIALVGLVALAQDAGGADVAMTDAGGFGPQIVDGDGMTVYLFMQDEEGSSACIGVCTSNWKPVLVDGEPAVGEGLDPALAGTLEREDGTIQLTYGGHPLYTYVRDFEPGDAHGQALGDLFYVLSASGERVTGFAGPAAAEVEEDVLAELVSEGETAYGANCAACHGTGGEGLVAPKLAGNSNTGRTSFLVGRILNGYPAHGMPAFRDVLSDRQVAAVASYVRTSWGNDSGAVTEGEVAELR